MPLLAAGGTLLALVAVFLALLPLLGRPAAVSKSNPQQDMRDLLAAGQRALGEGSYFLAARQLSDARLAGLPYLSGGELRRIDQLRRQAQLLARLHSQSLEEILQEASLQRSDDEWQERFRTNHQGRSVLFDDEVTRDAAGRLALGAYVVQVEREQARVALEDLQLFKDLPLVPPQRMLFGGRIRALAREGSGWVVHFEADSGVMVTDIGAANACLGSVDADLLEVLRRQAQWLDDLPSPSDSR